MKKIIAWLEENGIEYSVNKYGNPQYFNDGFSVDGIHIAFYFDGIGNKPENEKLLTDYMKRKKSYSCQRSRFGAGYTYRIMRVFDAARLEKHEKAVADAAEKFWKEEHARRMQAGKTA
ncbi:MAG: hypothetical protein HFG89_00690 [Dorea sp.]|jgi:hypothetical protein|nr:hypothetical protein [Dorea sp.]